MSGLPAPEAGFRGASVLDLALAELRLNLRSPGYRVMSLILAGFTALVLVGVRYSPELILQVGPLAQEGVRFMLEGLLLCLTPLLVCGAARREHRLGMAELMLSKPP